MPDPQNIKVIIADSHHTRFGSANAVGVGWLEAAAAGALLATPAAAAGPGMLPTAAGPAAAAGAAGGAGGAGLGSVLITTVSAGCRTAVSLLVLSYVVIFASGVGSAAGLKGRFIKADR